MQKQQSPKVGRKAQLLEILAAAKERLRAAKDAMAQPDGEDHEVAAANADAAAQEIAQIDRALSELRSRRCRSCKRQIPPKRLIANPAAHLCVQCQAEAEQTAAGLRPTRKFGDEHNSNTVM